MARIRKRLEKRNGISNLPAERHGPAKLSTYYSSKRTVFGTASGSPPPFSGPTVGPVLACDQRAVPPPVVSSSPSRVVHLARRDDRRGSFARRCDGHPAAAGRQPPLLLRGRGDLRGRGGPVAGLGFDHPALRRAPVGQAHGRLRGGGRVLGGHSAARPRP